MQLSHSCDVSDIAFDDPNLLAHAGLVPVMALAERAGLPALLDQRLTVADRAGPGHAGAAKVTALVAGMAAGADSIDDMDVLRHGAMPTVFTGVRAPSTLGTFLRAFTFGHVRQLDAVSRRLLLALGTRTGLLAPCARKGAVTYVDVDDTMKEMHGYAQQGVAYGYTKVKGQNAQIATASVPADAGGRGGLAPVIVAARLRRGNVASAHGAGALVAEAVATAKAAGTDGQVLVRADSAYYGTELVWAARRAGARFSVTARQDAGVRAAITRIPESAWRTIEYTDAVWDDQDQRWISDAQVAEIEYTAFNSRRKKLHMPARLLVRRVKRLNARPGRRGEQGELFDTWRFHAVFTDNPAPLVAAEATHRDHAAVETTIADLKAGPLAHLPSGTFTANAAWLVCAVITHNLLRAAAHLAGTAQDRLARARTATVRARLVAVPARIARSARRVRLHLPTHWPWAKGLTALARAVGIDEHTPHAATGPPPATT